MAAAARKAALKLPGWSDTAQKKTVKGETILKLDAQQIVRSLTLTEVSTLVTKSKEGTMDLSSPQFQLENTLFLREAADALKVLVLSENAITEFGGSKSSGHLSKLKRLELNHNCITLANLRGLKSLETLNLASNRLDAIPDFTDQEELVYLDLSGNRITSGFSELGKLKNLKVLDLGDCGIDLPESEFYNFFLPHLKKLTKLEYVNFSGNPILTTIREFRYFAIQELPKVKYLNWELISKEDRSFASDLATSGTWDNKTKPVALHSTSSSGHLPTPLSLSPHPRPVSLPRGDSERIIKQGTYASSRLGELLAAEEASASLNMASTTGTSSAGGSHGSPSHTPGSTPKGLNEMDELDKILDGIGKPEGSSPKVSAPSLLDELDMLLASTGGLGNGSSAHSSSASGINQAGNRGSFSDLLSGVLLDDATTAAVNAATRTPSPKLSSTSGLSSASQPNLLASGSGTGLARSSSTGSVKNSTGSRRSSISSSGSSSNIKITTVSTPAASGPIDPLDELDSLLENAEKSQGLSGLPSGSYHPTVVPSNVTFKTIPGEVDPLDDLLGQLDEALPGKASTASEVSSPGPKLGRIKQKPKSTIFEDLESDILDLTHDIATAKSNQSTPRPGSPHATHTPKPSSSNGVESTSGSSTRKGPAIGAPLTSAIGVMSNNSDLDLLENDITAMINQQNTKPAVVVPPPSTQAATNETFVPVVSPVPQPQRAGGALAALANFTSNIGHQQLDSLLDAFDSATAKALSNPNLILPVAVPATTSSPPTATRSLQRGPRPSVSTASGAVQEKKPAINPWEIPSEDLILDFLLGRGVWGETFEGGWKMDHETNKTMPVTIKRLYNKDFTPESVSALMNETKDLLELKHPNLVPLVGCSIKDNKNILWRAVNGAPLWGYLRNPNNNITAREVLQWARQLASALAYLHEQQIIHGGVKTSNIIIDKEHNLKLKDFAFMDYKDEISLTDSDPRWLAPEIITGRASGYNEKIDVYAFGMVVYEMMMRESPFVTMKPAEIIDMLTHRVITPECVPGIFPPVFIRLLSACWSHEPNDRPTMEKLFKILQSDENNILGDYAEIPLVINESRSRILTRPTGQNPMAPRPSEPPKPVNLPSPSLVSTSSPSISSPLKLGNPKGMPSRPPAASFGTYGDASSGSSPLPAAPSRPSLRVAKPAAIKPLAIEDLSLEVEQERKLVALVSKLQEMLASGEPEQQNRALSTFTEVVKDEKRINYVATRSLITRDLVEMLRANSIDTINGWRFQYPTAFETIELIIKTVTTICATDKMSLAFLKHGMMETLVEFIQRGVDSLKILAGQAIYEICLTSEGRTGLRKAAGISGLILMLKNKSDFVQTQAAWTLSSVLEDETNQEDFVSAGGLQLLQSNVTTTNAALRLRVLDALSNFWSNEKARDIVVGCGLKEKLLQMINAGTQMLQSTALRGIAKFTKNPDFEVTEVESLKVLKVAMEVIQSPTAMMRDKMNAITITENLTKDKSNMANFRDMGGMSMMVKALQDAQIETRLAAITILQRALGDERSRDAIIALGAVAPLIAQLASSNQQVRIRAIAAVDILKSFPRGKTAVIANAGVSRLVSIVAYSEDAQEQVLALQLLDFFSDNPDHKEEVREAGGLTAILQGLASFPPEGKLLATMNIGHLCSTEKNRQALAEQKGVQPLIATVHGLLRVAEHAFNQRESQSPTGDRFVPDTKLMTSLTSLLNLLYNMAEVAEFRPALRDADAAQFTCEMLTSHSEHIQVHAIRALTALAKDPKNKVVIRTGAGKRLKEFALNSTNTLLASSASQVNNLIDANN